MKKILFALLASVLLFSGVAQAETIKIGFNIPLTGDIPDVGESSKEAAEMLLKKVNDAGGVEVGGKAYMLEFVYEDNESKAESALSAARKLITQDEVLGIIGPQSSKQAVPAGEAANDLETPMISPWSTNPDTTKDRPFVFRGCFLDPFQGPVVVNFASEEFGASKASVLYDIASDYPKGLAEVFKEAWEKKHGEGTVVAFETFTTKDVDFSAQLTNIVNSEADVLFVPQYYNEVPLIVKQAQSLGWDKPIIGADAWAGGDLMSLCGDSCKGYFFSTHYAAAGAEGATKEFIEEYKSIYGDTPDDVAALTWDSTKLMLEAIKKTGGLTGDIDEDRVKIKDALGTIEDFEGITGTMTFTPEGDPIKCAVVVKINEAGEFSFYKQVCP
ncbi:MAG: ABC transporter substrate-binding protein [Oceanidesulfovibrio sp.]